MTRIPEKLHNPDLRFFLIREDQKLPLEMKWNSENNYPFFHSRLLQHLKRGGNYGIACGFGNLIVLDFDDAEFYNTLSDKLPLTFAVQSASKRTYHMYYYLDGEMFSKKGIDKDGKRVCDIQADRSGVVGPNSNIARRYYDVRSNNPIATITIPELTKILPFTPRKRRAFTGTSTPQPEKVEKVIKLLAEVGIERTLGRHFRCPFHEMSGTGNLYVMDTGSLYCFHEQKYWNDIEEFIMQHLEHKEKKYGEN